MQETKDFLASAKAIAVDMKKVPDTNTVQEKAQAVLAHHLFKGEERMRLRPGFSEKKPIDGKSAKPKKWLEKYLRSGQDEFLGAIITNLLLGKERTLKHRLVEDKKIMSEMAGYNPETKEHTYQTLREFVDKNLDEATKNKIYINIYKESFIKRFESLIKWQSCIAKLQESKGKSDIMVQVAKLLPKENKTLSEEDKKKITKFLNDPANQKLIQDEANKHAGKISRVLWKKDYYNMIALKQIEVFKKHPNMTEQFLELHHAAEKINNPDLHHSNIIVVGDKLVPIDFDQSFQGPIGTGTIQFFHFEELLKNKELVDKTRQKISAAYEEKKNLRDMLKTLGCKDHEVQKIPEEEKMTIYEFVTQILKPMMKERSIDQGRCR